MTAKKSFFKLLEERRPQRRILWAPCIFDAFSASCAREAGFEAVTISSGEMSKSMIGVPMGLQTFDELAYATERICSSTDMAVLCDGENGGGTPEMVYRFVKRVAEAGAMAVTIEDTDPKYIGMSNLPRRVYRGDSDEMVLLGERYMDAALWATNVRAAVEAVKGTECMVIARVDSKGAPEGLFNSLLGTGLGLEEAIRRANMGVEAGAPMTMIQSVTGTTPEHRRQWREITSRVPGYHVFPDLMSTGGKSDADVQELYDMGYQMVTCHGVMRGAFKGMMEYLRRLREDQNTVYMETDPIPGYPDAYSNVMFWDDEAARNREYLEFYRRMGGAK